MNEMEVESRPKTSSEQTSQQLFKGNTRNPKKVLLQLEKISDTQVSDDLSASEDHRLFSADDKASNLQITSDFKESTLQTSHLSSTQMILKRYKKLKKIQKRERMERRKISPSMRRFKTRT